MLKIDGYEILSPNGELRIESLTIDNRIGNIIKQLMIERDAIVDDQILQGIYDKTLEDLGIPVGTRIEDAFLIVE